MSSRTDLVASSPRRVACLLASLLVVVFGCGDPHTFKTSAGHIDPSSISPDHACFDGSTIELMRYSTACAKGSKSLAADVRDGTVFSAEDVGTLESPCDTGPSPAVEVSFDTGTHSLVLSFSQVSRSGRFPDADFDGYIFDVTLQEANGLLIDVTIDDGVSNLGLGADDIVWDPSHIEVNFAGTRYDQQSLLKLDLLFARISPVLDSE